MYAYFFGGLYDGFLGGVHAKFGVDIHSIVQPYNRSGPFLTEKPLEGPSHYPRFGGFAGEVEEVRRVDSSGVGAPDQPSFVHSFGNLASLLVESPDVVFEDRPHRDPKFVL